MRLPHRVLRALERFNARYPWDHNAHHHRWIIRQLPRRLGTALDVGCGAGDLARLLATRAAMVHGIDADPEIVARARESTDRDASVSFMTGDALTELPDGSYDAITCVAVLHHLPFVAALSNFRDRLTPGGTLVVVGLYRSQTLGDHVLSAIAIPSNLAMGWAKNKGRRGQRPVANPARSRPASMTYADIVREAQHLLPGVRIRRRVFWRYTLVWRKD